MAQVRHIVMLTLKDELTASEKAAHAQRIKTELEGLKSVIPGIETFTVHIDALPSSNVSLVFDSIFVSEKALSEYQTHPEHVKVAEYIHSIRKDRSCIDFYVDE